MKYYTLEEIYRELGMMVGESIQRECDNKAFAVFDYMDAHWREYRGDKLSLQNLLDGSKEAWDKAKK